jgi:hypothetical protein
VSAVRVERKCPECRKLYSITVSEDALIAWHDGMKVQRAFPDLTPSQRELLITGICSSCWDTLTKEE